MSVIDAEEMPEPEVYLPQLRPHELQEQVLIPEHARKTNLN